MDEEEKFDVRIVISSLGNERRTVLFRDQTKEESQQIISTINSAFGVIRSSEALLLTGSDGQIVFANLENVAFVEVEIAH